MLISNWYKPNFNLIYNGSFFLVNTEEVGPKTSLNTYLRNVLHLTATKSMCLEGGCGTCIVAVEETINGKEHVFAVNSVSIS